MGFRLAHISDVHLGPLLAAPARDLLDKRGLEQIVWRLSRGKQHDMGALAALAADLVAHAPDHIAFTGDIGNTGACAEFARAADWLRRFGAARDLSFVPGNHDAIVPASSAAMASALAPWMTGDDGAPDRFPYLRRRGEIAIVGLSSAVATAPFLARGRVDRAQIEAAARLLGETGREGRFRIVLVHHAPVPVKGQWRRGLEGWELVAGLIADVGAELVLHGHEHRASAGWLTHPGGAAPVLGAPSMSAGRRPGWSPAGYHLLCIERAGGRWRFDLACRSFDPARAAVIDCAPPLARFP